MLKDEVAILLRKAAELAEKNAVLEADNRELKARLEHLQPKPTPGDKCPYCNRHTGRLEDIRPDPEPGFAMLGVKQGYYKCGNPGCGKQYDKEMPAG